MRKNIFKRNTRTNKHFINDCSIENLFDYRNRSDDRLKSFAESPASIGIGRDAFHRHHHHGVRDDDDTCLENRYRRNFFADLDCQNFDLSSDPCVGLLPKTSVPRQSRLDLRCVCGNSDSARTEMGYCAQTDR